MAKSDNKIKTDLDNVKSKNKNTIKIVNNLQTEKLAEIVLLLGQINNNITEIKAEVKTLNDLIKELDNGENGK